VPVRAKRFEYAIAVDRAGRLTAEGGGRLDPEEVWTADHLLLAALARCTIESLRFHAGRAGLDAIASAEASGVVTKREQDGRYAFVEIDCALDVELDTTPAPADLDRLIELAERDCFVGASLTVAPRYRWRVNGTAVGNVEP
jgi:organic hydroperoxide reductase OsmC/OhrA